MDPETRKKLPRIFFFLAAVLILVKVVRDQNKPLESGQLSGLTMGTIPYVIKYGALEERDLKYSIDSLLREFNQSLSTYIPDSEISRFNRFDTLVYETTMFSEVLMKSNEVHVKTRGAFDPTVGPLVNAWGFGPNGEMDNMKPAQVDSLLNFVGFDRLRIHDQYVVKPKGLYLDFSAIAKGYAIDLIAKYLEDRAISNYMVEIGGEVRTKGKNEKNKVWTIGIEDPLVDPDERKILFIVRLNDRAVATSGNYRNYYEKDGLLYAHIIDPRTGYTSTENILSVSVFAADCMTADAYATAFMVLGVDKALEILREHPELDAILVYRSNGGVETIVTDGIKEFVTES